MIVRFQEPLKGHSKSIQNFARFRYPFFIDFGSVLGGFWEPCWLPWCTINWAPIFEPILDRFFMVFWSLGTLILLFSLRRESKNHLFRASCRYRFFIGFEWQHDFQNPAKNLPKSIKINEKRHQKYDTILSIFYRFWTRFGSQVGTMLGLSWPQTLKKATSKTTQKNTKNRRPWATPEKPGNLILGALNNTENNPVQATITENTPSQLALWRIYILAESGPRPHIFLNISRIVGCISTWE